MNYYNELKRKQLNDNEKQIIIAFFSAFLAYIESVEEHIFKGNEIRNDKFADIDEKQSKLKALDSVRTTKHNQYLQTVNDFSNLYTAKVGIFIGQNFLRNRATMADLGAIMCYNVDGMSPQPKSPDGALRDQLTHDIHKETMSIAGLKEKINSDFAIKIT